MAYKTSRRELLDTLGETTFRGEQFDTNVSFIWVEAQPGEGPRLHRHAYDEVFVVLEGTARFRVGDEEIVATSGDILVGPANVPHAFVNAGPGVLRQMDLHVTDHILTEWLEEDD
jgi:mannose-6-phosphate isomerase-like protein (cupin superfamily)